MALTLNLYLNESIVRKPKTGTNFNGKPNLGEPQTILARTYRKNEIIKDNTGKEVVSNTRLYTKSEVKVGDYITIDGRDIEVIAVAPQNDLGGTELYRKVFL